MQHLQNFDPHPTPSSSIEIHSEFKPLLNWYHYSVILQMDWATSNQNNNQPTLQIPEKIAPPASLAQILWHFLHIAPKTPRPCHQKNINVATKDFSLN